MTRSARPMAARQVALRGTRGREGAGMSSGESAAASLALRRCSAAALVVPGWCKRLASAELRAVCGGFSLWCSGFAFAARYCPFD